MSESSLLMSSVQNLALFARGNVHFPWDLSPSSKSFGMSSCVIIPFRPRSFWKSKPGRFTLPSMGKGSACTAQKKLGSWCWRASRRACVVSSGCYSQVRGLGGTPGLPVALYVMHQSSFKAANPNAELSLSWPEHWSPLIKIQDTYSATQLSKPPLLSPDNLIYCLLTLFREKKNSKN